MPIADRTSAFFRAQGERVQTAIAREQQFTPFGDPAGRLVRVGGARLTVSGALGDLKTFSKSTQRAIGNIRRLRKDTWLRVDPELVDLTMQWVAAAAPPVARTIEKRFIPLAERAYRQWPVRSGASQSGLHLSVSRDGPGRLLTRFASLADYTFFIKYARSKRRALSPFEARVVGAIRQRVETGWDLHDAIAWAATAFNLSRTSGSVLTEHNAIMRAVALWQRATDRTPEQGRKVYRLPTGADAAGEPAWRRQAHEPFQPLPRLMAADIEHELEQALARAVA